MSQLDEIEARLNAAAPGAITITPSDIHYLRTLARKQAAALEAVRELAAKFEATQSCDIAKRDDLQFDLGYSAGRRSAGSILRTALEPTP